MASIIPTLDLGVADNPATRPALLGDLRHAITEVGFLYVVNHGVPDAVVADVIRTLPELFALPSEIKKDVALQKSPHFLGYSAAGTETTAGRADRREQFEFATELEASWVQGRPLYERLRGPNQVGDQQVSVSSGRLTKVVATVALCASHRRDVHRSPHSAC